MPTPAETKAATTQHYRAALQYLRVNRPEADGIVDRGDLGDGTYIQVRQKTHPNGLPAWQERRSNADGSKGFNRWKWL